MHFTETGKSATKQNTGLGSTYKKTPSEIKSERCIGPIMHLHSGVMFEDIIFLSHEEEVTCSLLGAFQPRGINPPNSQIPGHSVWCQPAELPAQVLSVLLSLQVNSPLLLLLFVVSYLNSFLRARPECCLWPEAISGQR